MLSLNEYENAEKGKVGSIVKYGTCVWMIIKFKKKTLEEKGDAASKDTSNQQSWALTFTALPMNVSIVAMPHSLPDWYSMDAFITNLNDGHADFFFYGMVLSFEIIPVRSDGPICHIVLALRA